MIEQIKNAFAAIPSGAYTLLAPLLLAIGTSFVKSKKIKELQDIAERNIKLLKDVPKGGEIYARLEGLVLLNLDEIRQESTRTRDWNGVVSAVAVVALGGGVGFYSWQLWGGNWLLRVVAAVMFVLAIALVFGGVEQAWKAWRGEGRRRQQKGEKE